MHPSVETWLQKAATSYGPFRSVLDIGGRDVNGTCKSFLGEVPLFVSLDKRDGPGVDIVVDVTEYSPEISTQQFQVVTCTNVLEHEPQWKKVIENAYHFVEPWGYFILTTVQDPFPHHSGIDGCEVREEEWYSNHTDEDLSAALIKAGFFIRDIMVEPPDLQYIAQKLGTIGEVDDNDA